jgi:hypothetical protein
MYLHSGRPVRIRSTLSGQSYRVVTEAGTVEPTLTLNSTLVSGCTFTLRNDCEICVRCSEVTLMLAELDVFVLPVVLVLAAPPVLLDALPVVELPLVPLAAVPDVVPCVVPDAVPCFVPEVPDVPDWALSVEAPPVVEVPEEPPVLLEAEPEVVPLDEPDAPPMVDPEELPDEPPGVMIVEPPEEPPEAPPELLPPELLLVWAIAATLRERVAAVTPASKVTRIG